MDIFGGWQDYTQRLESNWRALISDEDTVVIPGDISWAMSLEGAEEDFRFIHNLPVRRLSSRAITTIGGTPKENGCMA